ncbi:RNA-binding protein Nova-2-like isoform X2 [Centruroides sculpturatus]|uniref:RNA-binding protein Nova-2-like isoform X2 n=1 Tax=Centruroides sculpturatus TaxID=218467 RepID=UPI000C6E250F|nr:RNA-binding protein Nova-2-like isoform X2 [Centruroides sculpturatus]
MATGLGGVNGCPESEIGDSRKRPLDTELDIGTTKRSHHGGVACVDSDMEVSYCLDKWEGEGNGTYHFKILVPAVAAGAIIGKGGETIAQLQKEAGARVKMSKAHDFYPGTTERVCLITGNVEGILHIHEFIMEKIKEKPDPNAKMAIDFDHKQPAEREKQVKILVPNSTAGMIIGKGGSYIKQIKEESGAYVQISQKSKDHALTERCITVIGEMENNKRACAMILAKIVEDPQSGSCLNVSYADVTGPVANFNPTGSPFANPGSVPGSGSTMNNSNASYSSNGSLNSLSPTVNNSFNNPQTGTNPAGLLQFSGVGVGMGGPGMQPANIAQLIENIKVMLRGSGYSEHATAEIAAAMNTLASYNVLGLGLAGLGGLLGSISGTPVIGSLGMGIGNSAANSCQLPPGSISSQGMYTSTSGIPGMEPTCNTVATSGPLPPGSSMFGPIGSLGAGGLGLGPGFSSPTATRSNDRYPMHVDGSVFDPFHRNSPALGSPAAAALPVNNNSFGLGIGLNSGPVGGCKSPTLGDGQVGETTKIEVEIGENIVGAILGPGGKSLVDIQRFSGASIQISKKGIFAPGTRNRIVTITGTPSAVANAQYLIEQQIADEEAKRARQNSIGVLR